MFGMVFETSSPYHLSMGGTINHHDQGVLSFKPSSGRSGSSLQRAWAARPFASAYLREARNSSGAADRSRARANAAPTNSRNSGAGRSGRDLNSG
jgi:hypothetical protein